MQLFRKKIHPTTEPHTAYRVWQILFFSAIAGIAIELVVFSVFFLHMTNDTPSSIAGNDPELDKLSALHKKVLTIQTVIENRTKGK